ncbi:MULTISPECIES: Uma2 family endonuclease [Streptomyces]|uniref:Uma2 family endonuclease n=1 Tax=Streptomyces TaxID=1883 RepID=UPI00163BFD06|nr:MULTISPECIES: Uma2 family endonuclease [Streptomyces]MBC2877309.1 Uma2 family endonuclease [Streptomyces sp. TYQ1024]UBI38119.1 Uma2 family endonuclease [Streptomyces mobaraensis]UKW30704.1 Uma2 family endonuclease [Streptomyces sp. TYQ1024]
MAGVADSAGLDEMFALIEAMNVPPGYRVEIIGGQIVLNPHRKVHSTIIRRLVGDLTPWLGLGADVLWDVRVDFPGGLNGYAPDVALLKDGAEEDEHGRCDYHDVEFVAEVVSEGSRRDDYDAKLKVYAAAGIPTYLIADPKTGVAHVFHAPRDGVYTDETSHTFGEKFALPGSGIVIDSTSWPRD